MLRLENFDFGGPRLTADFQKGRVYALRFDSDALPEDFIERYLSTPNGEASSGEIWLTELRDAAGRPSALRDLSAPRLRAFLHHFVGLVLPDGGLLDGLTLHENILLPFRYHQVWPADAAISEREILSRLHALAAVAGLDPSPAALAQKPAELDPVRLRLWGLIKTLVRQPRILILFAPLSGLGDAPARRVIDLLRHHRDLRPEGLLIFPDRPNRRHRGRLPRRSHPPRPLPMNIAPSLGLPVAVRQRLIAGLCASAVLVFLAALLIWSRGWLQARSAYHIALLESAGVSKSSAVFIHWIHVGRVGEVGLSGEGADLFVEVGFWVSPQAAGWIEAGPRKVVVRRDLMGLARLDVVAVPEGETAPATATDTPAPPWRGGARLLASEI